MSKLSIEQLLSICDKNCDKLTSWGKAHTREYQEYDSIRECLKELQMYRELSSEIKMASVEDIKEREVFMKGVWKND